MILIGIPENVLSLLGHLPGQAIMDLLGWKQTDTAMAMLLVLPSEEAPTESPGIFDRTQTLGKLGPVLEGFKRVVLDACHAR